MQMKTTMADDCFPLDSLGALLPFSVLHKTTPTTGAPFASEFHHLVSSFCFVSTHTHTQNLLSPTPLFDWAYTCTLSPGFHAGT